MENMGDPDEIQGAHLEDRYTWKYVRGQMLIDIELRGDKIERIHLNKAIPRFNSPDGRSTGVVF
jgi:hypothetical protein